MIKTINPSMKISSAMKKMLPGDILLLEDGVYKEKIEIWKQGITIQALHPQKAILTNKDYAHKIMNDNNECNTFRTYTLYIGSDHVTLKNLVIQNEAYPSSIYGQAVALHVDGNHFICEDCLIQGAQDTLFTGPLPKDLIERYQGFYPPEKLKGAPSKQIYKRCIIKGDIDFIFGCATALFEDCIIESINGDSSHPSYICAPAHPKNLPFGYLFYKCEFIGQNSTFLARPWRDYGCSAFINCKLGDHIVPQGYHKWNNTNRDKTARFFEYTPSANLLHRVRWVNILSPLEATKYYVKFTDFLSFH